MRNYDIFRAFEKNIFPQKHKCSHTRKFFSGVTVASSIDYEFYLYDLIKSHIGLSVIDGDGTWYYIYQ
jgi:hypothetical protein